MSTKARLRLCALRFYSRMTEMSLTGLVQCQP
jgi:hypothetical protein